MQSKYEFNGIVRAIISFTESDTKNKQGKQNEQQESESTLSLAQVTSSLESLWRQIDYRKSCKSVIQIPKLLQSLSALSKYKVGAHLRKEMDLLRLKVRYQSRECLRLIQVYGEEQVQSELVRQGYGRVMTLSFSTAGGIGDEKDEEISYGLNHFYFFLRELYEGRTYEDNPSFQPLPLLARMSLEQIEEEGANEEIDAQMNNKGLNGGIKREANYVKAATLNHFINWRSI
ncbi:MAG: hypothetical protein EZS28_024664 [Streblomastix strix]|uniref:Uncharacterized protein n=1 Tax=Streblomastix strix TaxID=222440 RepID=A0A5J4VBB6_9EUKA|nr:MAG: hypothetical protein EZS28_024664 [Streblomastix strix]